MCKEWPICTEQLKPPAHASSPELQSGDTNTPILLPRSGEILIMHINAEYSRYGREHSHQLQGCTDE